MRYIILIIFSLIFFVGCANTPKPNTIVKIVDRCSNHDIRIDDIKGRVKDNGFMQAQITGENLTNSYFRIEYRIVWFDENEFKIQSILSKYTELPAYANQPFIIDAIAPNNKARSFRVYLKKEGKIICDQQSQQF